MTTLPEITALTTALALAILPPAANAATYQWWHTVAADAPNTNGSITLKDSSGTSHTLINNPTGATLRTTRSTSNVPPTINIQATGGVMTELTNQATACTAAIDGQILWNRTLGTDQICDFNGAGWTTKTAATNTSCALIPLPGACNSSTGSTLYYVGQISGKRVVVPTMDDSSGIQWFNGSYSTTGATNINDGQINTTTIITNQGNGSYAAKLCANKGSGWFLPSKNELLLMYSSKAAVGGFSTGYYWSSTEYDYNYAWYVNFTAGSASTNDKHPTYYVRCARRD